MTDRDAPFFSVPIADLRPTQITVGFREVEEKCRQWQKYSGKERERFLSRHLVPTVLGPKDRHYLTDHHHLVRALASEGVETVMVNIVANLSMLEKYEFWVVLDNRHFCHPYDDAGRRQEFNAIPKAISDLVDDPYRSLSGALRRAGGYAKDATPFSEFQWSDFLRRRVDRALVKDDFATALVQALTLAKSPAARYLPGWCGPHPMD